MFTDASAYNVLLSVRNTEGGSDPLTQKLRAFQRLRMGWSHGEGRPLDGATGRIAEHFVAIALQFQLKADIFPGLNGECAIAFYQGERTVEIVIDPSDLAHVDIHVEEGRGFAFRRVEDLEHADHSVAVERIFALIPRTWTSPESCLSFSSTQTANDFPTSSSDTHLAAIQDHLMAG